MAVLHTAIQGSRDALYQGAFRFEALLPWPCLTRPSRVQSLSFSLELDCLVKPAMTAPARLRLTLASLGFW